MRKCIITDSYQLMTILKWCALSRARYPIHKNISNEIIYMLLEEAQILYHSLKRILKDFYNMRVYCVGSMARHEKNVDDIDLITADPILGTNMKYIRFKYSGIYVNIWRINDVQFAKCMRSFNKIDSIVLRSIAKKNMAIN